MNLNDNWQIPVTDEQVEAFKTWAEDKYDHCRNQFEQDLLKKDRREIELFFTTTIFSPELCAAWWECVMDERFQTVLRRLKIKITRTGTELVRRAFPREEDTRLLSDEEWRESHTRTIHLEHKEQFQGKVHLRTMIHHPTEAEKASFVPRACAICLSLHALEDTCVTICGHEFGTRCLQNWEYRTCPSCSTFCMSTIALSLLN